MHTPGAVVAVAAVSDMAGAARDEGAATELLDGTPEEVPERYRLASPRERLLLGVLQLLVHGERDDRVPVAISRDHAAAARAGGDAVELVVPESTGHAELIDPGSTARPAAGSWLEPRNRGAWPVAFAPRVGRHAAPPAGHWRCVTVPTYIALITYTDKGVQSIKELPKRIEKARELMGQTGVRMTSVHLTMGRYDAVSVFEAPDDATVAKALLTIAGQGNVRTETLRAFDEAEAAAIVGSL
jgi:uncharacterized protein with GYD domain